jgi:hypothetical protein
MSRLYDEPAVDTLIERLRERAADPERRVDARESEFFAGVKGLELGGLLGMLGDLRPMLDRALDASRSGQVDPEVVAKADEFAAAMSTPVESELPPPATPAQLERAEASLGLAVPDALRRLYGEVANGGFGPGYGLVPIERMVAEYQELCEVMPPTGHPWPVGLLPVIHHDPDWDCVEASTGRVVAFDWEEVDEDIDEPQFARAFRELAPSIEAWLEEWVASPNPAERDAAMFAEAQVRAAQDAREAIAKMTPEARAAMGLPEVGWENVVWGGIGLEEDPTSTEEPGQE